MPAHAIGTAFVPVTSPQIAAEWYREVLGLDIATVSEHSAVLFVGSQRLTLMGPASGISAQPGLTWATCNFVVDDVDATYAALEERGLVETAIRGDRDICRYFSAKDLDGNVLLVVDR
ncbi:VOC family protein [Sanguibacter suaedae]|uniref:VOC family protein n=1 Tax=Sanguibacter suaedae TaxID=2795737 RepID=A0A934M6J2_9MICO|nr:VOC family protein [Sanguibacter suaedae]MBI9114312.1 VOC family protein [Sanguibacter suaedae]